MIISSLFIFLILSTVLILAMLLVVLYNIGFTNTSCILSWIAMNAVHTDQGLKLFEDEVLWLDFFGWSPYLLKVREERGKIWWGQRKLVCDGMDLRRVQQKFVVTRFAAKLIQLRVKVSKDLSFPQLIVIRWKLMRSWGYINLTLNCHEDFYQIIVMLIIFTQAVNLFHKLRNDFSTALVIYGSNYL